MTRFPELEQHGVRLAAISGFEDGDCGFRADDPADREAFVTGCGISEDSVVGVKQVHGTEILIADSRNGGEGAWDNPATHTADGIVTNLPGLTLAIAVADCVPVYLFAPDVRAIGLLHAGREGTLNAISAKGVQRLVETYAAAPKNLIALIGPSICGKCYEVSQKMADAFRSKGYPAAVRHLDLWAINRQQLLSAGLPPRNIHTVNICTLEDPRFHSHRESVTSARNLALLEL